MIPATGGQVRLAPDPRWCDADDTRRVLASCCWHRLDAGQAKRRKKAGKNRLIPLVLLEDSSQRARVSHAASTPPLRQNIAELTRIVLSLDEENADLKARVAFIEGQLFGPKSEKMTTIDPVQATLDLGDLSDAPVAANDEVPSSKERERTKPATRSPSRNIGQLPNHLPRYDVVASAVCRLAMTSGSFM
jgi:hypothetical protein